MFDGLRVVVLVADIDEGAAGPDWSVNEKFLENGDFVLDQFADSVERGAIRVFLRWDFGSVECEKVGMDAISFLDIDCQNLAVWKSCGLDGGILAVAIILSAELTLLLMGPFTHTSMGKTSQNQSVEVVE